MFDADVGAGNEPLQHWAPGRWASRIERERGLATLLRGKRVGNEATMREAEQRW